MLLENKQQLVYSQHHERGYQQAAAGENAWFLVLEVHLKA